MQRERARGLGSYHGWWFVLLGRLHAVAYRSKSSQKLLDKITKHMQPICEAIGRRWHTSSCV